MPMTVSQKILAAHAGLDTVKAGQLIYADVDLVVGNDITSPVAIHEFERAGAASVFDRNKIALILDHFVPSKDIKAAEHCSLCRSFAKRFDISNFYDVGEMGIEHALIPEKGLAAPGELIVGADSHICTYGALGSFSTGFGSTDMAAVMMTGKSWLKVPAAIKVVLHGKPRKYVSGKDVILHLIGLIGVEGALYQSLEFFGDGVAHLSIDDRLCIANMVVEAGGKNGIFPVDEIAKAYLADKVQREYTIYTPDEDAPYVRTVEIDLADLKPIVAFPHLPGNAHTADERQDITIDQVVIGSCTNGRISDMEAAYRILKGKHIAKGVRAIIIPATQQVYLEALRRGYIEEFIHAGCVVSTPTCGPCLGGYMGILAAGERCVSTTNRNFVGRMGHTQSEVYLASPMTAAASALTGHLTCPSEFIKEEAEE